VPRGTLRLDKEFRVSVVKRVITVFTETRRLLLVAETTRAAKEWEFAMREFYAKSSVVMPHLYEASFPPRDNCDVKVYTYTRDYMHSLGVSLLSAQKEILITSWKNSPTVILTRPPYPTLRLDQVCALYSPIPLFP
jgi:hypothetical protein